MHFLEKTVQYMVVWQGISVRAHWNIVRRDERTTFLRIFLRRKAPGKERSKERWPVCKKWGASELTWEMNEE
ncbi:MAG: hypothetical protein Q4D60_00765 [Eubacteriales bacterium]|nr:hypothetical protein [Eubacteriales bacterium]